MSDRQANIGFEDYQIEVVSRWPANSSTSFSSSCLCVYCKSTRGASIRGEERADQCLTSILRSIFSTLFYAALYFIFYTMEYSVFDYLI